MSFRTAGQLLVRRTQGEEPRRVSAGFVTTLNLKLSLVPEDLPVQDVRLGEWGNFRWGDVKIEIVRRGTLSVEYENPADGEQVRVNIDCGILPPAVWIPYNLILSTKDVSKMFPHAFPVELQLIVLQGLQYDKNCLICAEMLTGSCVLHGGCIEMPIHPDCFNRWIEYQPASYEKESLLEIYPECPNCRGPITAPWVPRSAVAALRAAVASALGEGFLVISEHKVALWSLWSHHPVREQGFDLWVQTPNGRLKKYFLRKRSGPAAEHMKDAEYNALSVISKTSLAGKQVPKPAGFGSLLDGSITVYFNIDEYLPQKRVKALEQVTKLLEFQDSEEARGDNFGFSAPTLFKERPQYVTWHTDWVDFLDNWTKDAISFNKTRYGPWQNEEEFISTFKRLVELLIRPLNARPSLILGNLCGNLTLSVYHSTSPIYGHDEWEWAFLCGPLVNLAVADHKAICAAVEQQCGEPKAQLWDRCRLYYASQQLREPERNERVEYDNNGLGAYRSKLTNIEQ